MKHNTLLGDIVFENLVYETQHPIGGYGLQKPIEFSPTTTRPSVRRPRVPNSFRLHDFGGPTLSSIFASVGLQPMDTRHTQKLIDSILKFIRAITKLEPEIQTI